MWTRRLSSGDWLPARTFHRGAEKPRDARVACLYQVSPPEKKEEKKKKKKKKKFLTTDLNNSFYALGHVELWKNRGNLNISTAVVNNSICKGHA